MKAMDSAVSRSTAALVAVTLAILFLHRLQPSAAYTDPEVKELLCEFKNEMAARGPGWQKALRTWGCPCGEGCDPCGDGVNGNWNHMHCRGLDTIGKEGRGSDGFITNLHIVEENLEGGIPWELCKFPWLREIDFDGGPPATEYGLQGSIPEFLSTCFPDLAELDLKWNELTGRIPTWWERVPGVEEFEVNRNQLTGPIPEEIGRHLKNLRQLELQQNRLTGRIPGSLRNVNDSLTTLFLKDNDLAGPLYSVAGADLVEATVQGNARLCGMIPGSIQFAKGFNAAGTNLGQPCPEEVAAQQLAVPSPPQKDYALDGTPLPGALRTPWWRTSEEDVQRARAREAEVLAVFYPPSAVSSESNEEDGGLAGR